MNDLQSILDIMRKPFKLEVKTGCQDWAVLGGLKGFITNWVEKASEHASSDQKELL